MHPVIGPKCNCLSNFRGDKCEIDDLCPHCDDHPLLPNCSIKCKNNGFCQKDASENEFCKCVGDWEGKNCETPPRCVNDECGKCSELSSINECICKFSLIQPCLIADESVVATEMLKNDHETLSIIIVLMFTLIFMSTLAVIAVFYLRRWQRRTRFFAHARLNENVEEITNPIFDFSATDRDDITMPTVTNISSNDEKVNI